MSHMAIAAALALEGVSGGERLVAFSLASFANREGKAWPGTPAAAARAGLSRARFLECRERLVTGDDDGVPARLGLGTMILPVRLLVEQLENR